MPHRATAADDAGAVGGRRRFAITIDIAAPPERVWAVMSDIDRWPEMTASMTSVTRTSPGRLGVGSTARVKQPKLAPADFVITSWQPGRGFEWVTRNALVTARAGHDIEPAPDGTRVTLSVEFSGPLGGLVAWLYGNLTARYIRMEAEGLRQWSERPHEAHEDHEDHEASSG
jgi:carbon monoxide dehydrogenase subunit G